MEANKLNNEIWKPVKDYENYYEISNFGNFRSLDRYITRSDGVTQLRKGRLITQHLNSDGYLQAKLCKDGVIRTVRIHRLVADAFLPNPDELPEVNHKDCNRANNHISNLEWCSHIDNIVHSAEQGKYQHFGDTNPNYQNDTLKKYYQKHPEEAVRLLSRPGAQNGRAKPIRMYDNSGNYIDFSYIGECAQYMINEKIAKSKTINTVRDNIRIAVKNHISYLSHTFEFIN